MRLTHLEQKSSYIKVFVPLQDHAAEPFFLFYIFHFDIDATPLRLSCGMRIDRDLRERGKTRPILFIRLFRLLA
jgi:hypothetical protein